MFFADETQIPYSDKSLLRYPGGKSRAVQQIMPYFPRGLQELCSPFFGGGAMEIYLASKGIKVYGYDVFNPLVEFWQCVLKYPDELADAIVKYYPLSKNKFYQLQSNQTKFTTKLERAAVFYILNRASFSGSTLSGGMSPHHPRFTPSSIERVRNFHNKNLVVSRADFKTSIAKHNNTFLYLDPPYLIKNALYGKKGNVHKGFDHLGLCKLLKQRKNWILSYNDCDEIRSMYADFKIVTPSWKYGMSSDKKSKELLIINSSYRV